MEPVSTRDDWETQVKKYDLLINSFKKNTCLLTNVLEMGEQ